MKKLMMTILLVFCCVPFVTAQNGHHKFEVYGGFSRIISSEIPGEGELFDSNEDNKFNGFNAAGTFNFSKYIGAKIDFTHHSASGNVNPYAIIAAAPGGLLVVDAPISDTKHTYTSFQGGIQVKNNSKAARFKPFGHVLLGMTRQSTKFENADQVTETIFGADKITSSGFSTTFGGGLDIRVGKRIDLRVIQVNYNLVSVPEKTFFAQGETRTFPGGSFTSNRNVDIESYRQKNITFGFGIVFH